MRRLLAALLLSALAPACGVEGLNFVQDDRVTITAPRDRAEVRLPVTIRWKAEDFDGTYAVFVDRAPVPPGETLAWLARDDELLHLDRVAQLGIDRELREPPTPAVRRFVVQRRDQIRAQ